MPNEAEPRLFSRYFLVLFFQALCCNCYIAVFYCMEQWMAKIHINPSMRGILLALLPAMVMLTRPSITCFLDGKNKTLPLLLSIALSSITLIFYPFISEEWAVPSVFCLRVLQGLALAVYSSCTTTVLVDCLPHGQSARGFAFFSFTLLLPYAIIPAVGESLILLTGGEAELYAWMSLLGIPALLVLPVLIPKLKIRRTTPPQTSSAPKKSMWKSFRIQNLGLVYFASFCFSLMINQAIFFVKGLCQDIDALPAYFFTTYTTTIILIRLVGNTVFDRLPRASVIVASSMILAVCTYGISQTHGISLIPYSFCYGLAVGLLYPLLAALIVDRSSDADKSINSNLMMTTSDCSSFLAPVLGGLLVHCNFGYQGVFVSASLCISLCGLSVLLDSKIQKALKKKKAS